MSKRFKTSKKDYKILKSITLLLIIYISFKLTYNLIYNLYLKDLTNEQIITHIINNTKNNKTNLPFLTKYQNPESILSDSFNINKTIKVDSSPKDLTIYIYTTHETEKYSSKYLEVYNIIPTVKTMSYILKDYLTDLGLEVKVEEGSVTSILKENNWSYKYSYAASKKLISSTINDNPNLKLIIDLHRDSSSLNKTLLTVDNTNYARILFVIGAEHDNYEANYKLASLLNNYLEEEVPGISRGITKKSGPGVNGIYNQDLSPKSVLIELGGQYNEIEELNNSLKILAKVILRYIEGEQWKIPKKLGYTSVV